MRRQQRRYAAPCRPKAPEGVDRVRGGGRPAPNSHSSPTDFLSPTWANSLKQRKNMYRVSSSTSAGVPHATRARGKRARTRRERRNTYKYAEAYSLRNSGKCRAFSWVSGRGEAPRTAAAERLYRSDTAAVSAAGGRLEARPGGSCGRNVTRAGVQSPLQLCSLDVN